ncbi:hypothetical protein, partial [Pantoea sp.]|uniref:hypothetical protein n=1 Tax=Pantoea sp. TaxID=69393 RepID=UPI0028AA55AE
NLDDIAHPEYGATFFKNVATINNDVAQLDLVEQCIRKFAPRSPALKELTQSPTLRQSMLRNLLGKYAESSTLIKNFLQHVLLPLSKDALLLDSERAGVAQLLRNEDEKALSTYQFLINQLKEEYPELVEALNRHPPMDLLIHIFYETLGLGSHNALFYCPDSRKVLAIPNDEFNRLITAQEIPPNFQLLEYDPEKYILRPVPGTADNLISLLRTFPALHSLWSTSGRNLSEVITTLFSLREALNTVEQHRATEIENHIIARLTRQTRERKDLTSFDDLNTLGKMLSPFNAGIGAEEKREALINLTREKLGLNHTGLSGQQEKAIAAVILARALIQFSSAAECGNEEQSPYPLGDTGSALIDDAIVLWSDIAPKNRSNWKELLSSQQDTPANRLALLASRMAAYHPPGLEGWRVAMLIQQNYPLL